MAESGKKRGVDSEDSPILTIPPDLKRHDSTDDSQEGNLRWGDDSESQPSAVSMIWRGMTEIPPPDRPGDTPELAAARLAAYHENRLEQLKEAAKRAGQFPELPDQVIADAREELGIPEESYSPPSSQESTFSSVGAAASEIGREGPPNVRSSSSATTNLFLAGTTILYRAFLKYSKTDDGLLIGRDNMISANVLTKLGCGPNTIRTIRAALQVCLTRSPFLRGFDISVRGVHYREDTLNELFIALQRTGSKKAALAVIMKMFEPSVLFAYVSSTDIDDLLKLLEIMSVYKQPIEVDVTGLEMVIPPFAVYTDDLTIDMPEALVMVGSPIPARIELLEKSPETFIQSAGTFYVAQQLLSNLTLPTVDLSATVPILTSVSTMVVPGLKAAAYVGFAGAVDDAVTGGQIKGALKSGVQRGLSMLGSSEPSKQKVKLQYGNTYLIPLINALFERMEMCKMSFETSPTSITPVTAFDQIDREKIRKRLIAFVTKMDPPPEPGRLLLTFISCFYDSKRPTTEGGGAVGGRRTRKRNVKSKKLKLKPRKSKKQQKRKTRRI